MAMSDGFICPLCDSMSFRPAMELKDRVMRTTGASFRLVRCSNCGLLRLQPQPDTATLTAAYSGEYTPHLRTGVSGWAKGVLERRSARLLDSFLAYPRRVLDVGSATGDLLLAIKRRGNPNVTGVETSSGAVQQARGRGLDVRQGELEDAAFEAGEFDTVLLSHTLEHVADPLAFMREVHRVLRPGGTVMLWLPNADSIECRVFGRFWIGYDAPRHLTTFSVGTLGTLLHLCGFRIVEVRHEAIGLEWAWGVRLLLHERFPAAECVMCRMHPLLIVLCTPLAFVSARLRRSGRVRVMATR